VLGAFLTDLMDDIVKTTCCFFDFSTTFGERNNCTTEFTALSFPSFIRRVNLIALVLRGQEQQRQLPL
jgi:hypothetical protein